MNESQESDELDPNEFDNEEYNFETEEQNHEVYNNNHSNSLERGFDSIDSELLAIEDATNNLRFSNPIALAPNSPVINLNPNYNFDIHYDLSKGQPVKDLRINLGTNDLPRFSCGNHKLNLAVRDAISKHPEIKDIIFELEKSNSHIRRCIQLNRQFRVERCRLQLDNATRWSSAYILLESVKRAYDKKLFADENSELTCPIDLRTIELYLQILRPAYLLSLSFQLSSSSIADTIPSKFNILI